MLSGIITEIFYCKVKLGKLTVHLGNMRNRRESLLEAEDEVALRDLDDQIEKCEAQIIHIECRINGLYEKFKELFLYDAYYDEETSKKRLGYLRKQYNARESWLRSQECLDANGKQTTYWDLFLADQPDGEMWDYID